MRVEYTPVPQPQIDAAKNVDKKEITGKSPSDNTAKDESALPIAFPFGSGRTYSLSSLRTAVEYHAKFLTVAENNLTAIHHASTIPQEILERLNGK